MDRHNHYEAAFAAFLRDRRVCHVAVDETRRSYEEGDASIKSVDFVVQGKLGERYVVDVKGRRFPGGTKEQPKRTWECWATRQDVIDARRWAAQFGANYQALFVFSYYIVSAQMPAHNRDTLWSWQDKHYILRAVPVNEYAQAMRVRSNKWGTVYLQTADFHRLVRPLQDYLPELNWALSRAGGEAVTFSPMRS
jgi:hypothetical protein